MTRVVLLGWALLPASVAAEVPEAAEVDRDEAVAFFEKHVRPLLIQRCYECHSDQASILQGGLRLDSRQGWQQGGDQGPAVIPHQPDQSLLIQAVRYETPGLEMPPEGKLSAGEVELLARWVQLGAPDPRDAEAPVPDRAAVDVDAGRGHWAFQPPQDPPLPEVADPSWAANRLDRFILAGLQQQGLQPAPPADRRTLIRRVTFGLTGLPPTAEQVEAFVADQSPGAYGRLIERLLASPHYGQRWGRHWLDVARYADSNGLDENVVHGNAWRYRDYVVQAFNDDKPYDQFLVEQLAGDLLPETDDPAVRNERLVATGFLALGPKVLAEADKVKMEMDIIDEQIDTLGRSLLGLTLGCARCHDHKFDPVRIEDYYGLAGIFKSTRTMESFETIARWHENPIPRPEELARREDHQREVEGQKQAIEQLRQQANQRLVDEGEPGFELPEDPEPLYDEATRAELKRQVEKLQQLEAAVPELPAAMGVTEGSVTDVAVHIRGNHEVLGEVVPRGFPAVLVDQPPPLPSGHSGRLELARWLADPNHPLTARVMVNRVWRWHFGRGLVASVDNFGAGGEPPSHPELLDWLAHRFIQSGWSVKALHRLILLSATYQMSSRHDEQAARVDPRNRLLWRMNLRRLEAESLRDALLAAAGSLDTTMGGPALDQKNRTHVFDHTSQDATTYEGRRRSLYLPVIRNHLYEWFTLFDYADASVSQGDRPETTIAPQALLLLNSPLALDAAGELAGRLLAADQWDDPQRVRQLYLRAYGRPAGPQETARALAFVERFAPSPDDESAGDRPPPRQLAWQALCQAVLTANEFVYLR